MNEHVPPPDPSAFWEFSPGQTRTIGVNPLLAFRVNNVGTDAIDGTETLADRTVHGVLRMGKPCVISRDGITGEPLVTLTLRKIENGRAFIQVTANPKIPVGVRQ